MTHIFPGSPALTLHIQTLIEIARPSFVLGASVAHPMVSYSLRFALAGPLNVLFDRTGRATLLHCRPEDSRHAAATSWDTSGTEVRSVKAEGDVDPGYRRRRRLFLEGVRRWKRGLESVNG